MVVQFHPRVTISNQPNMDLLTTEQISNQFADLLVEQLGLADAQQITAETKLADLGADSLDVVEITMAVEEDFSLHIPDEEAAQLEAGTVAGWVQYIFDNQ